MDKGGLNSSKTGDIRLLRPHGAQYEKHGQATSHLPAMRPAYRLAESMSILAEQVRVFYEMSSTDREIHGSCVICLTPRVRGDVLPSAHST